MRAERKTALEVVLSALLSLHGGQMTDKDMPQRGKIRYVR